MVRAVLLAMLVGCYAPSPPPGVACTTACPGDQVCENGTCQPPGGSDAAVDGAPIVDRDGDGTFDDTDNCIAIANPDQHDEDADALGDACDPCPHLAFGADADDDGDGVGNACDPQPENAGQRWLFFDPFTTRRSEWPVEGAATFAPDQMTLLGYQDLAVPITNARVALGGSIVIGSDTPHQGVLEFGQLDPLHSYFTEFYDAGDGGAVKITKYDGIEYTAVTAQGYAGVIPAGPFTWTVDVSVASQRVTFAATHGGTVFPTRTGVAEMPALGTTQSFLFGAVNVTITYDYVAIIETP